MTQRERVLELLEGAGSRGVTTGEFIQEFIPRFSARIEELRAQGHEIRSKRLKGSSWRYTLIAEVGLVGRTRGAGSGEVDLSDAGVGTAAPQGQPGTAMPSPAGAGDALFELETEPKRPSYMDVEAA